MHPIDESGTIWSFSPSTHQWTALNPSSSTTYPESRSYHCTTSDSSHTLYLHGGCPEKGRLSDLWSFDITHRTWKQLPSAPDPPCGGASIAYVDGKIYRMNGFNGKTEQGGKIDIFDLAQEKWSSITFAADGQAGPQARSVAALLPVHVRDERYLVTLFGESDPSSLGHQGAGRMLGDVWAFSLRDGKWTKVETGKGAQPDPRGWYDADVVRSEGKDGILVVGGLGEANNRLDDAWLLNFD